MTLYVKDGLQDIIMVEVSRSATLDDLKKKLNEKEGTKYALGRYIHNGKIICGFVPLYDQGVKHGSQLFSISPIKN